MENTQEVLVIGLVWPEPASSAAGSRMLQLIRLFQESGWRITFASPAVETPYKFDLESIGVSTQAIVLNSATFDAFVKGLNPTMVLFDRFMIEEQFGWRVAEQCPDALRVLDTEDLHCLRLARQKALKANRDFTTTDLLTEEVAKREVASILRCDISLLISEVEMELLQSVFKIDPALLHYLPLLADRQDIQMTQSGMTFEERKDFIFVGNFLHEPNRDAVHYLKESVWPLIRAQLPDAGMCIYGAYPSQSVLQLHQPKERFFSLGRADDAQEVVAKARVMLAPLRFGAGMKGKLLEAMQCGTPSVTTAIGAESMYGDLPWNGFITDDPQLFADNAVQLYTNERIWKEAQENGVRILEKRYLKSLFATELIRHILTVQQHLNAHRLANFTGAMLNHHTLASTKYLSRWIEAKGRRQ